MRCPRPGLRRTHIASSVQPEAGSRLRRRRSRDRGPSPQGRCCATKHSRSTRRDRSGRPSRNPAGWPCAAPSRSARREREDRGWFPPRVRREQVAFAPVLGAAGAEVGERRERRSGAMERLNGCLSASPAKVLKNFDWPAGWTPRASSASCPGTDTPAPDRHEEIKARRDPSRAVERDSSTRHDHVPVRVMGRTQAHEDVARRTRLPRLCSITPALEKSVTGRTLCKHGLDLTDCAYLDLQRHPASF
jgi:hypothetical protein